MATRLLWSAVRLRLTLVVAVLAVAVLAVMTVGMPPIGWLPKAGEADALLGSLLGAQAAVAALTLAVTLFLMQGIGARRDVDDRVYREYIHQLRVRFAFRGGLGAVFVTGVALMVGEFTSGVGWVSDGIPGLQNLTLFAVTAFVTNLLLAVLLFERALQFARPERWRMLRRFVNERDVRRAVRAFLQRSQHAVESLEAGEPDISTVFPGPDEGSADEAVRALLDDARAAMAERRQGEFRQSLESIKSLVEYSMDEIERSGVRWSAPGQRPEWPPVRELVRNLYSFREEIVGGGNRDYVLGLVGLDHWFARTGVCRRCGELFTFGLDGYRWNYRIASRDGAGELREMLRDRFSLSAGHLTFDLDPAEAFPYAMEMVQLQERLLSDAMDAGRPEDFVRLHEEFDSALRFIGFSWERSYQAFRESAGLSEGLQRDYRVALMGLAGRAIFLAESGSLADVDRYLEVAQGVYNRPAILADDIAEALGLNGREYGFSIWDDWEMDGRALGQVHSVSPERYPLAFFGLRLMELCSGAAPVLDLHGNAKRVLDWFSVNSPRLVAILRDDVVVSAEQRREWAAEALGGAARRDEVAEDFEIIGRELSADKVSGFASGVYSAAFVENSIERLFEQEGAFLYLSSDAEGVPEPKGFQRFELKAFLTDSPEKARHVYFPLDGSPWGRGLSDDVMGLLCEALDKSPQVSNPLEAPGDLLAAIDQAMEDLNHSGGVVVVLAGDWSSIEVALDLASPEGYEAGWRLSEGEQLGVMARYRGHPMLRGPTSGQRRMYVFEPRSWGCFVRAQFEGAQDLSIEIRPVSAEWARELLDLNPSHFPDEPDRDSKLRKLQTRVEVSVWASVEFRVSDRTRARRILPVPAGLDGCDT